MLKILIGKEATDTGTITINKDIRMAYLPQEPELDPGMTILDSVLSGGNRLIDAVKKYEEAMDGLAENDSTAKAHSLISDFYDHEREDGHG